ncbi:MAG: ATP-binding protein, partial [Actinomycetes bacterium]
MRITSGVIPSAQKCVIYGVEGVGKSTLAAEFAEPLFIDTEGSTKHMDVKRLPTPDNWTMLLEQVRYVYLNPTACRTLVIDTADWAERLCISHICAVHQVDSIEKILNGYGKGYVVLAEEFGNLLNLLTDVVGKDVNVVMTAHAQIKKFEQPDEALAYDRWILKLGKQTSPLVREWADMVLFANYKTIAVKSEATKTPKGAGGKRTLFTSHKPAFDAKNRHGLPDELPFEDGRGNPIMPAELLAAVPPMASSAAAPQRT